ncbi:DUF3306 domain-containing protein [Elioraea tepidiphila]|jgi:hypothetical protein|uniref:DUF3306 domain-containing protein n=1 Tax=Elioraea tepidiphila TaxID=457934 RepID=UPI000375472E|nr:DUF3306 domain-containing protein [Elioraea tepidiphila]
MAEAEDREGFLARWSRRKRAAREGVEPPEPQPAEPVPVRAEPAAAPEPEEPIDLSTLPKIEELTPTSDITAFLRKGVPLSLRNAALRRMWSLDPAIRDYIGPVDYGWDWNTPGGAPDYVAEIGETPEIRDLVARMLSPAPPQAEPERPPEREAARPERLAAEPGPTVIAPPAVTVADAKPADADGTPSPDPLPPAPRPRHGGAMPS